LYKERRKIKLNDMASTTDFIAAIELGSSKIAGIAGRKNDDGSIRILAWAKEDSSPALIRKGVILNLAKTAESLTSVINKLEHSLNSSIDKVYVGIGGQSLHTVKHTVVRYLEDETVISQELIDRICHENRGAAPDDPDILDVAPQEYKVGNTLQTEPVGILANYIEGRFMNIVARTTIRKNLKHCFSQAKIEIAGMFPSPLVTAKAVLTEDEMRAGCALVDFGADTTTVSVYKGNILRFLSVIPLGGNTITHDITSLGIEEREAEELKLTHGNALSDHEAEAQRTIPLKDNRTTIELSELNNIIGARAEELTANVLNQIKLSDYADKLLSGIVITGGGANLRNMDKLICKESKTERIRVAAAPHFDVKPQEYAGLKDGTLNTLFGLLAAGTENCCRPVVKEPDAPSEGSTVNVKEHPKPQKHPKKSTITKVKEAFGGWADNLFTDEEMK
jgi:cell division protein FtsA